MVGTIANASLINPVYYILRQEIEAGGQVEDTGRHERLNYTRVTMLNIYIGFKTIKDIF